MFESTDSGSTWVTASPYGHQVNTTGTPRPNGYIYAATHGRGIRRLSF